MEVMDGLSKRYTLKEGSVKEPDAYLGATIKKWTLESAVDPTKTRWAMSSDLYVARAVADVEIQLHQAGNALKPNADVPMTTGYRPEMDTSKELDNNRTNV